MKSLCFAFAFAILCAASLCLSSPASAQDGIAFWEGKPRFGANSFNYKPPAQDDLDALAAYGGEWLLLTWTKWESHSGGAFLIGDPSNYTGLVKEDVDILKEAVSRVEKSGLKVVLMPITLPGAVWTQHNGDEIDDRLFSDNAYWDQSAAFWTDLADIFKNDPTVVAYNLLNEPAPERAAGYESGTVEENIAWYAEQAGTARDLPALYDHISAAIRTVDPDTPIMVDGGFFANPEGFSYFPGPLRDPKTLYAYHMAKPWAATSVWNIRNGSKLTYPGEMAIWGKPQVWDAERVERTLQQPLDWADKHGIDRSYMVLSEFGCHRYLDWCATYMEDVLSAADADGLHWAFYTFRSDNWGGRDFELGGNRPDEASNGVSVEEFWQMSEQNCLDELPRSDT